MPKRKMCIVKTSGLLEIDSKEVKKDSKSETTVNQPKKEKNDLTEILSFVEKNPNYSHFVSYYSSDEETSIEDSSIVKTSGSQNISDGKIVHSVIRSGNISVNNQQKEQGKNQKGPVIQIDPDSFVLTEETFGSCDEMLAQEASLILNSSITQCPF